MSERLDILFNIILRRLFPEGLGETVPGAAPNAKLEALSRAVARLSELYTRERADIRASLLQEAELRRAYLAYFLPTNIPKIIAILEEIWLHPEAKRLFRGPLRILDLGCGPGTSLLGCLDFLSQPSRLPEKLECVAVDSLESNLQDTRYLFEQLASELLAHSPNSDSRDKVRWSLETCRYNLIRPLRLNDARPFEFIILGNVLNELFPGDSQQVEKRSRLVAALIRDWLAPNGFLILLEPALRDTSRELLRVRDRLLAMLPLTVYSPCVHSAPCPAIAAGRASDWCHEDRPWKTPAWIREIDDRTGLCKSSLKYSYVTLNRMGLSIHDAALETARTHSQAGSEGSRVWRVVSETLEERGKASVYLCGAEGRFRVTRLHKHASPSNADFQSLNRGQVVSSGALEARSELDRRVKAETLVQILTGKQKPC